MSNSIFICFCEHFASHYNTVWSVTALEKRFGNRLLCRLEDRTLCELEAQS